MLKNPPGLVRLLAALIGTTLALVLAAPAQAFLRDVELFAPRVASHNGRPLLLTCPNGKALVGMGAAINAIAATGGLGLNKTWISANRGDRAELSGVNTDTGSSTWSISGQVTCAGYTDTPPTSANGGPYLKDIVVVRKESTHSSDSRRTISADCGGRRSIGGGFALLTPRPGSRSQVVPPAHVVADAAKILPPNRFSVSAHETQAIPTTWWVQAYAICANYTDYLPGPIYVGPGPLIYTSAVPSSSTDKNLSSGCPMGWFLIGGGARVTGASPSQAPPHQVVLRWSQPDLPSGSSRSRSWLASAAEEHPTTASWRLEVKSICAPFVFQG